MQNMPKVGCVTQFTQRYQRNLDQDIRTYMYMYMYMYVYVTCTVLHNVQSMTTEEWNSPGSPLHSPGMHVTF